jgi:hypothetical protein
MRLYCLPFIAVAFSLVACGGGSGAPGALPGSLTPQSESVSSVSTLSVNQQSASTTALSGTWTYLHGTQNGSLPNLKLSASGAGALQITFNTAKPLRFTDDTCDFVPYGTSAGQSGNTQTFAYIVDPSVRVCKFTVSTTTSSRNQSVVVNYSNVAPVGSPTATPAPAWTSTPAPTWTSTPAPAWTSTPAPYPKPTTTPCRK